jgi:hypothetical protein
LQGLHCAASLALNAADCPFQGCRYLAAISDLSYSNAAAAFCKIVTIQTCRSFDAIRSVRNGRL